MQEENRHDAGTCSSGDNEENAGGAEGVCACVTGHGSDDGAGNRDRPCNRIRRYYH